MTLFKAILSYPYIIEIDVDNFNDRWYWADSRRRARFTKYESLFETKEEAEFFVIGYFSEAVEHAKRRLNFAERKYEQVVNEL